MAGIAAPERLMHPLVQRNNVVKIFGFDAIFEAAIYQTHHFSCDYGCNPVDPCDV